MERSQIGMVCLDISGTLTSGSVGPPFDGAVEAVRRVMRKLPVRFVTNVTSRTHREIADRLASLGVLDDRDALLTPATTARRVLQRRHADTGLLLVDGPAAGDFDWFRDDPEGPTVLLGTEGHDRRIGELQPAFRRLLAGADLYALQRNRYFEREGELWTDVGPLAAFLAYAAEREVQVLGKPSKLLFDAIAAESGLATGCLLMVGDDAEFDVSASVGLGLHGVLVRTGRYRPGDEARVSPPPTDTIDSLADLPRWLGLD